jgi:hypothetical protein
VRRGLLFSALVVALAASGWWGWRATRVGMTALRTCEASAAGDAAAAVAVSEALPAEDLGNPDVRLGLECRCAALSRLARGGDCLDMLDAALSDRAGADWVPPVPQVLALAERWQTHGQAARAADLASRARAANPASPDLIELEARTVAQAESPERAVARLRRRIPELPEAQARTLGIVLASQALGVGAFADALTLGGHDPPADPAQVRAWANIRSRAQGALGDRDGLVATLAAWQRRGGHPGEVAANYALLMSHFQLADPTRDWTTLLADAASLPAEGMEPSTRERLLARLVTHLALNGRLEEALRTYDEAHRTYAMPEISRAELERLAAGGAVRGGSSGHRGRVEFHAPGGGRLLVAPDASEPPDAAWTELVVDEAGPVVVERSAGVAPLRWVWRADAVSGGTGSGLAWVRASGTTNTDIRPGAARRPPSPPGDRRPGDGRPRVWVVVVDCLDWRVLRSLQMRGEMPTMARMLASGWYAVLHQEPALTAAAMEALVYPEPQPPPGVVGVLHQLGTELAGLASVGRNPFGGLSVLMPPRRDLFTLLGAGTHVAANLLFSHGGVDAGRHATAVGPGGAEEDLDLGRASRPLTDDERAAFPELEGASARKYGPAQVETLAAEFDMLAGLYTGHPELDLVVFRAEPTDILSHGFYAATVEVPQDDGVGVLYEAYRYVDHRLGQLEGVLDADDSLVVMSDHGLRASMEHDPSAVFVVTGPGVPVGRAEGAPELRGVPRVLAALLGHGVDWPDTGVAPWATAALATAGSER